MTTTISSKGQIILPAELRRQDRIETGQEFDVQRLDAGEYLLKRKATAGNEGLVDWLLSCPAKGWLKPLKNKETTNDIRPVPFK